MKFIFKDKPRYHWDAKRRIYVDAKGRKVPDSRLRADLEAYIDQQKNVIGHKAEKMVTGTIATTVFFQWMRERVNTMHDRAAIKAYGGLAQMSHQRWARVEKKVLGEYKYLSGFELDVAAEPELATALWPIDRAKKYADSIYSTYQNNVKARESDIGVTLARRVCLNDDNTCSDCPDLATSDFIPLHEVTDIGVGCQCQVRCRCYFEFSYHGIQPLTIDRGIYARENVKPKSVFLYFR